MNSLIFYPYPRRSAESGKLFFLSALHHEYREPLFRQAEGLCRCCKRAHQPSERVRALRAGFIDAIGAVMWCLDRFWPMRGSSKRQALSEPWPFEAGEGADDRHSPYLVI